MFQDALLIPRPVTIFFSSTFVMFLLTLGQPDFQFGATFFPVHRQWYQGVAFAFHGTNQLADFFLVQQQFTGTNRVGVNVS